MEEEKIEVMEDTAKRKHPWTENIIIYLICAVLLMFGGQIIGSLVVGLPVGIIYGIRMLKEGVDPSVIASGNIQIPDLLSTCMMYIEFLGIWAAFLLWYLKRNNRPLYRSLTTYTRGNTIPMFLLGILLGFIMNGACILAAWLHGDIVLHYDRFEILPLLAILVCVFIQSSAEEVVCRSYLYQKILKRHGSPLLAILANSVLFALLHIFNSGVTVLAIVDIFVTGIMFSMFVYYFDSIWLAFGVHTMWNFTQNIIFGLPNSGQMVPYSIFKLDAATDSLVYNVGFGVEGTIFAIGIQVIACILMFLWARKHPKEPTDIWYVPAVAVPEQ